MRITICGGGNLGHVTAGYFSSQSENEVLLFTTKPEIWENHIEVVDNAGDVYQGTLKKISSHAEEVIPDAEMVLLCLPGFAIGNVLKTIVPYLNPKSWVGSIVSNTGFFFEAAKWLSPRQPLFGFQRVPFISRIIEYGKRAELKGYKSSLSIAVEQTENREEIRTALERLFKTPVQLLGSHYEVSLSNSNPLLHTSRLYTMWKDWMPGTYYDYNPGFYSEWTQEASDLYIAMDNEFQPLLNRIGLREGAIPPVLKYYESEDSKSLTKKISSIPAFQGILSPMKINSQGLYEPDFHSRYFTEDFPYGMRYIIETAEKYHVDIPQIEFVYNWGMHKIEKK